MRVVPAHVRDAGGLGRPRDVGVLVQRQRVHVGAQRDGAGAGPDVADQAGAGEEAGLQAGRLQHPGDQCGGHVLGAGQLRVGVDRATPAHHVARVLGEPRVEPLRPGAAPEVRHGVRRRTVRAGLQQRHGFHLLEPRTGTSDDWWNQDASPGRPPGGHGRRWRRGVRTMLSVAGNTGGGRDERRVRAGHRVNGPQTPVVARRAVVRPVTIDLRPIVHDRSSSPTAGRVGRRSRTDGAPSWTA